MNLKLNFENNLFYLLLTRRFNIPLEQKVRRNLFISDWWLRMFLVFKKKTNTLPIRKKWYWNKFLKKLKRRKAYDFKDFIIRKRTKILKKFILPRFRDTSLNFLQKLLLFRLYRNKGFFLKYKNTLKIQLLVKRKNYHIVSYNIYNGKTLLSTSAGCFKVKKEKNKRREEKKEKNSRKFFFTFRTFKNRFWFIWFNTFSRARKKSNFFFRFLDFKRKKKMLNRRIKKKLVNKYNRILYKKIHLYFLYFLGKIQPELRSKIKAKRIFFLIKKRIHKILKKNKKIIYLKKVTKNLINKKTDCIIKTRRFRRIKNKLLLNFEVKIKSSVKRNVRQFEEYLFNTMKKKYFRVPFFRVFPNVLEMRTFYRDTNSMKLPAKRRL